MKTIIWITGQPNGNSTLKNALVASGECEVKKHFADYKLIFETKKEAVNALSKSFQKLKQEESEFYKKDGITYFRGERLVYDASKAVIQ